MNDERPFERLAAHAGPADVDPGFEDRLYALLQREIGRPNRSARPALLLVAALLAILVISAAVAVGSGLVELPGLEDLAIPSPPSAASESFGPTPTPGDTGPRATATPEPALLRPASTTRSSYPPGQYWWHGYGPVFMHNPTADTPGVEITMSASDTPEPQPGATPTALAGYAGTYEQRPIGADGIRTEVWTVDIDDTQLTIALVAHPDVTDAELAEGHAVVESIRAEPWSSQTGFRIVFTLPDGWDSA